MVAYGIGWDRFMHGTTPRGVRFLGCPGVIVGVVESVVDSVVVDFVVVDSVVVDSVVGIGD